MSTLDRLNLELVKSSLGTNLTAICCNGPVILWPDGTCVPLEHDTAAIQLARLDRERAAEKKAKRRKK